MAAAARARAEPTAEQYASWSQVGHALDWAGCNEYQSAGSLGHNILAVLGVDYDSDISDIGWLSQTVYESFLQNWSITNSMGGHSPAPPGAIGKAIKAGHAMRIACCTVLSNDE